MKKCKVEGCDKPHYSNGYCTKHRSQIQKYGRLRPDLERNPPGDKCKVIGCDCKKCCRGYCTKHYNEYRKYGVIDYNRNLNHKKECVRKDCDNWEYCKSMGIDHCNKTKK